MLLIYCLENPELSHCGWGLQLARAVQAAVVSEDEAVHTPVRLDLLVQSLACH